MGHKNVWILPKLLNSENRKLRNAGVSKKGRHDFALSSVNNDLQSF